jgi:hypothetical protein
MNISTEVASGNEQVFEGAGDGTIRTICGYFIHPAADEFPAMTELEFDDLLNSTRQVGQLSPVVVQGNTILEGRHRARVIEILRAEGREIELRTVEWKPADFCSTPSQFIENVNLKRRNLTPDQRAMVATRLIPHIERELAELQKSSRIRPGEKRNPAGRNQHATSGPADAAVSDPDPASGPPSSTERNRAKRAASMRGKLADRAGVSHHKSDQALTVKRHGSPDQIEAVREGKKKLSEVVREINEKRGKGAGTARTPAKNRKPIDHPFKPTDDFENDCLRFWTNFVTKVAGIAERDRARDVFREIFRAEEKPSKAPKPKSGTPGKALNLKKTGPQARAAVEEFLSKEDRDSEIEPAVEDRLPEVEPATGESSTPKGGTERPKDRVKKKKPSATAGLISPANLWGKPLPAAFGHGKSDTRPAG